MDADLGALPDDIDALKAAFMIERARMREVAAERDVRAAEMPNRPPPRYGVAKDVSPITVIFLSYREH
jgi:hypothetical protein